MRKLAIGISIILFIGLTTASCNLFRRKPNFDKELLIGKWQQGSLYERYHANGTGSTWDTADDVNEDEAQPFTWNLVEDELTQIHIMEMGGKIPKVYTITALTSSKLNYHDDYGKSYSFTKLNNNTFMKKIRYYERLEFHRFFYCFAYHSHCYCIMAHCNPERITPILKQTNKFILCPTNLRSRCYFSTFPHFGIKIKDLALINPMKGAQNDTLIAVKNITASINLSALLKENTLKITKISLDNTTAHLYINKDGIPNFDVFKTDTTDKDSTFTLPFDLINVSKVDIKHLHLTFINDVSKMYVSVNDVNSSIKGTMSEEDADVKLKLKTENIVFRLQDSLPLQASIKELNTTIKVEKNAELIKGDIVLKTPAASFAYNKSNYLQSMPIDINLPFEFNIDKQDISLKKANVELDKFAIRLDGTTQMAPNTNDINLNMDLKPTHGN